MTVSGTSRAVTKRKTCKRYNEPGHARSLTFSCFRRQPFLSRDRTRGWMLDAIERARRTHDLDLWAYVIMPEHVHILLYPRRDAYDISGILCSLKQSVSKRAILHVKRHALPQLAVMTDVQPSGRSSYRFWQRGGGYDRNLWSPQHVWETIDYIHANPVRRALCSREVDWSWSSARFWAGMDDGPLGIDVASVPSDPRRLNAP